MAADMIQLSVAHPWVDLPHTVTRVKLHHDEVHQRELNVVCQDTGMVVYTTPHQTFGGYDHGGVQAATRRAERFLHRHGFRYDIADHGLWKREGMK